LSPPPPRADVSPDAARKLYADVAPSLVAVKYTLVSELQRHELIGSGLVVGEDGLVMAPLVLFNPNIPDEQMKDFKIVVAHEDKDPTELDAVFYGRDERTNTAWLKTKETQKWKPVKFEPDTKVNVGDTVLSVGILPKAANYKPYFMEAKVSALLRGETPQILVQGGLAAVGSAVFTTDGKAIGLVNYQQGQAAMLNDPTNTMAAIMQPPNFFVPASDFVQSFQDPPSPEKPIKMPWVGVMQMTGLNEAVAEVFDLKDKPAVQIGAVIPGGAAEQAGLKSGNVIVKMNGEPLERGDEPSEIPQILQRKLRRMKPGDEVKFSVIGKPKEAPKEVSLKLMEMPKRANLAKRYFAEDLGFSVRELVFIDTYVQRLKPDAKGVVVALIRPQSAAQTGGLQPNDVVTEMNREPVTDLAQFQDAYEKFRKDKPHEAVVMVVTREGATKVIRIEPPQ
jgi:serine protease Do